MKPTNHASPEFSVVPVLPAAKPPYCARVAVPNLTGPVSSCVSSAASFSFRIRLAIGLFSLTTSSLSLRLVISWIPTGPSSLVPNVPVMRLPPVANVS